LYVPAVASARRGGVILLHENWLLRFSQAAADTSSEGTTGPAQWHDMADAIIAAQDISKRFGNIEVLRGVNLAVAPGDVVCIIGPSGSGKTTLLRCFALLETPSGGRILMRDNVIAQASRDAGVRRSAKAVRADIGMVFQHFNLWPHMTALENIIEAPLRVKRMGRGDAVALGERLLAKVGLSDKRDVYPGRLSGGQQQRVAIARALAMSPQVILFDEVTSALDPELRHEVLLVMRQLASEGMTMLVVTHEMGFARNVGSTVAFMDHGEIIETAPPAAFFHAPRSERARRFLKQFED
jgi:polar amino acid transport system ATP-binding protein